MVRTISCKCSRPLLQGSIQASVEVFFKIKLFYFLDALTQQILFLTIKMNIFCGDLSGISAKTATLQAILRDAEGKGKTTEAGAGIDGGRVIIIVAHMYIIKTRLTQFSSSPMHVV